VAEKSGGVMSEEKERIKERKKEGKKDSGGGVRERENKKE
jgi:hypothetical protein